MIGEVRLFGEDAVNEPGRALMIELSVITNRRREWRVQITAAWQQGVEAIFETGRLLVAARRDPDLAHGEWQLMVEQDLPFGARTARKLMAIANDERLLEFQKRTHGSVLGTYPPHWRTIYQLTTLDDDVLRGCFANGLIHPEMERGDIERLKIKQKRAAYEARAERGCKIGDLNAMAAAGEKFNVIYADPPWEFRVYSGKGKQRSAERYYDTSSVAAIKALPIAALSADNCALFLWCVMPELPGALEVIKAWGFDYKTVAYVWVKQNRHGAGLFTGMGYWTRANAEMVLLATRGAPQRMAQDVHQILLRPIGEHSVKPSEIRDRIERLLLGPYLELFARAPVDGWTVWGNEIESVDVV
jgi:N6-adenosine-specific RNA methylase IME4